MIKLKLSSIVIILVFIKGALTLSPSQCFIFDSTFTQWPTNTEFKSWPPDLPPNSPMGFPADSTTPYYWLQDISEAITGTLTSIDVTINEDDIISATLYRHLSDAEISDRISMSILVENTPTATLTTPNYDVYDYVSVECTSATLCCPSGYPCTAQLAITGEVKDQYELVAVNEVGINCNAPSPTPPPSPSPPTSCCSFTTDVCDWSLATVSNGWHWSVVKLPSRQPPLGFIGYIWVEDTTADVSSYIINYVDIYTTFELTYDFVTSDPTLDTAEAWFNEQRLGGLIANVGQQKYNFTCTGYNCCPESSSCSGQFTVKAFNSPGTILTLSIDTFCVN